ncbi:MAG: hypothetical protein AAF993_05970 [Pseudomonadota bacterium]
MAIEANVKQWDLQRLQQVFKWTVYALLLVNFVLYLIDDISFSQHTLGESSTLLDMVGAFATSLAVAAWICLIMSFELETYVLDEEQFTPLVTRSLHSVRLFCAAVIAFSSVAFVEYLVQLAADVPVEEASSLCDIADRELSFTYNIEYTEIDSNNCATLSQDNRFFWVDGQEVVTDTAGLSLERWLALSSVLEVLIWVVIIVAMELVVRLQDRGVTSGGLLKNLDRIKRFGYVAIICLALWWGSLGHWLYLWDTLLWVGGFAAIEFNVNEWRDELKERDDSAVV